MSLFRTLKSLPNLLKSVQNVVTTRLTTTNTIKFSRSITTTPKKYDLMDFFDDKKNWGVDEVKSGRPWKLDELRLKSNGDLHKLWYVLLKERNMLLTMEHESKRAIRLFPGPERIDKVEISMENIEQVVRERNKAYYLLETGETGERPGEKKNSVFGLSYYYKKCEHAIPKFMNVKWRTQHYIRTNKKDVQDFLQKMGEKRFLEKRRKRARDFNHVAGLFKRFPNMDVEALRDQYPEVDVEKAKHSRRARGHYVPS